MRSRLSMVHGVSRLIPKCIFFKIVCTYYPARTIALQVYDQCIIVEKCHIKLDRATCSDIKLFCIHIGTQKTIFGVANVCKIL